MKTSDEAVIAWIRDAAERIPIPVVPQDGIPLSGTPSIRPQLAAVLELDSPPQDRSLASRLVVAASILLMVGFGALAVRQAQPPTELASGALLDPPAAVPAGAPEPGSVAPHLVAPPVWFGEPKPGSRDAAIRTGMWTSAAIGVAGDEVLSPIIISVTDGTLRGLDSAPDATLDDTVRFLESNGWLLFATKATPTVVVSGAVEPELLMEVLRSVTWDDADRLEVGLNSLPSGYAVVVQPQTHAPDTASRRNLTNSAGDVSISDVSEWATPELAAAASGADYTEVLVNGQPAWTGRSTFNASGPLAFLVWSPAPGVVLEITTANPDLSPDQLIHLAEASTILDAAGWDDIYRQ